MSGNAQTTESSLLLQIPRSVLSFSDMTGNSFLMPVAVDTVADIEKINEDSSTSEKYGGTFEVSEPSSVCQLQQPLLMRRGSSSGPNMSVPYSESSAHCTNFDLSQTEVSHSGSHLLDIGISNPNTECCNWPASSAHSTSIGQPIQSFTGFQNQPSTMQLESVDQQNCSKFNQESNSLGYQNNFPTPATISSFPSFSETSNDCCNVSSAADYYSQPPVITPSTTASYYNSSRMNLSQMPQVYSSIPNQNFDISGVNMTSDISSRIYEPVKPYWLFRDVIETKEVWCGFSVFDSERLEFSFHQDPHAVVSVDGGRYDAVLNERIKKPVYFDAKHLQIMRCTWFYHTDSSQRFIPFPEEASKLLEQQYSTCITSGVWQKRVNIPGIGSVVLESPQLFLYYKNEVELWPSLPDSKTNPKTARRGLPESFEILADESRHIDHLVFIVQGIGSFCDLRFRTVTECVDGFRDIANKLLSSHFRHEVETGQVGRVEFLPLAWHAKLHTNDKGFDRCMQNITLPSIPKLRHFTNDTLLDILLYSSPFYCQSIINTVTSELNKLYEIFLKRNPEFSGKVFVAGHSLGSLILFDILAHQNLEDMNKTPNDEFNCDKNSESVMESDNEGASADIEDTHDSISSLLQACQLEEYTDLFEKEKIDLSSVTLLTNDDLKDLGLPIGPRKKLLNTLHSNNEVKHLHKSDGDILKLPSISEISYKYNSSGENIQDTSVNSESLVFPLKPSACMQSIEYPKLHFEPACFFALGSPISMFLTVRGYDTISEDFRFPTCPSFFHIFHPYDPVAFRIECLIDPNFSVKPVLIPHHKGRKRMHLEIRENLSKVGLEIKQKVLETLKYTWSSLSGFAKAHTFPSAAVEAEVDKLVTQQMSEPEYEHQVPSETSGEEIQIGFLNGGRRIDYVLQEKPIEALNDYVFALTSHATYWDSEDTVLMILREIYATQGIVVSSQSVLEHKQFIHPEQSSCETYPQLSTVMSNPCLHENSRAEQVPSVVSPFYNQSVPPVIPVSSQSLHSFNNYDNPVSQVPSNGPPPSATQPTVGPPPLTGFVKRSPFTR